MDKKGKNQIEEGKNEEKGEKLMRGEKIDVKG